MICINLLPSEEIRKVQFSQRRLPFIPGAVLVFIILFLYWLTLWFGIMYYTTDIHKNLEAIKKIQPHRAEVDILWNEVNNMVNVKSMCIDTIIMTPVQWSEVSNIISDKVPQGVWLNDMSVTKVDGKWAIVLNGFAKEVTSSSMIKDIGVFVTDLKDTMEADLLRRYPKRYEGVKQIIEANTTSKRKKADAIELTEFSVVLKVKV